MKTMSIIATLAIADAAIGCGSNAVSTPKTATATQESTPVNLPLKQAKVDDKGTSGMISISDDVRKACGISDNEAYFAFDSAYVRPNDRQTIDKLANCFLSGPMKGRQMHLVGHADPRGEDSYNLALGGSRADSVKKLIVTEGLPTSKVITTSRGEMDATGTDESTWARDRRVDILASN
jgi:peptidoglycan-associated lipoprotein